MIELMGGGVKKNIGIYVVFANDRGACEFAPNYFTRRPKNAEGE